MLQFFHPAVEARAKVILAKPSQNFQRFLFNGLFCAESFSFQHHFQFGIQEKIIRINVRRVGRLREQGSFVFCQKWKNYRGSMRPYIIKVKNSFLIAPLIRPLFSHWFSQPSQNCQICLLVNCNRIRHKFSCYSHF